MYPPRVMPTGRCSHCGRSIGTFKRAEENQLRACTHKTNQGAGTWTDPIQKRECPGSSQLVTL